MIFTAPPATKDEFGLRAVAVGTPAPPTVTTGDIALVFLEQSEAHAGRYAIVLRSFGYMKLNSALRKARAELRQELTRRLNWCKRIEDTKRQTTMQKVYQRVQQFVAGKGADRDEVSTER